MAPERVADTVGELKRGKIDFRVEKAGIIHASIGKVSMDAESSRPTQELLAALLR